MSSVNNTLSQRIFEALKDNILAGYYKPGDRLLNERIAQNYHVSMTPVREALLKLEQEGLVKTTPRKGTHVIGLTDRDIVEYTKIRLSLECLAVDTICDTRIPPDRIRPLGEINAELEDAALTGQALLCMSKDIAFHYKIVEISDNQRLFDLIKLLPLTNFYALRRNEDRMIAIGAQVVAQHAVIIEKLLAYDAAATKAHLLENILSPQLNVLAKGETPDPKMKL